MAAAAAAAAFSTISWLEAAAAKSDNVCAAELFDEVRLKAPESNKIYEGNKKSKSLQDLNFKSRL